MQIQLSFEQYYDQNNDEGSRRHGLTLTKIISSTFIIKSKSIDLLRSSVFSAMLKTY